MPNINDYYQNESEYLKASDLTLGQKFKLTIKGNSITEFDDNGKKKCKIVLHFNQTEKRWALNKTNALAIGQVYGPEANNWMGKDLFVYRGKASFKGETVDAVCVEMPLVEGKMQENVEIRKPKTVNTAKNNNDVLQNQPHQPPPVVGQDEYDGQPHPVVGLDEEMDDSIPF